MARTAKTKHVMDLVSSGSKKPAVQKPSPVSTAPQGEPMPSPVLTRPSTLTSLQELQKLNELQELKKAISAVESELPENNKAEFLEQEEDQEEKAEEPAQKPKITAVVLELINQELESVVERFKIEPTDNNLWDLTRAVLECIRPEFAITGEELKEKSERLRPRVISEMAKTAIKISKRK